MTSEPPAEATIRPATLADLPAIVAFEIAIARITFPRDPIVDPAVHEKKMRKALDRGEPGMFVLDRDGQAVGWLWVYLNTNFLTDERYATFRSLAVDETQPDASALAEHLFTHGVAYARTAGMTEITGKVHVANVAMRVLYRKAGFEAEHLTMRLYL